MKNSTIAPFKDLIVEGFMKAPFPLAITRAKDGTYVEANDVAVKYIGLKRKDIIGRKTSELGHLPVEKRRLILDAVRKQGLARNVSTEIVIKDKEIVPLLFSVYPFKKRGEQFFFIIVHAVFFQKRNVKRLRKDTFYKISFMNNEYINNKLKYYKLTSRQREIALLSATGCSNQEIGKKLFISEYTVKDHLKEIFRIVGIQNRSQLTPKLLSLF